MIFITLDELKARLDGLEWTDIEFKETAWQVPRDIFLHCWRRETVTLHEAQAVAGSGIAETSHDLRHLETQVLLEKTEARPGQSVYRIPDHLREAHPVSDLLPEPTPQVTPEVTGEVAGEVTPEVTPEVAKLIRAVDGAQSRRELQEALGLRDDDHMRTAYVNPALDGGWIEMTIPDKPQSSRQRYRLTEKGRRMRDEG